MPAKLLFLGHGYVSQYFCKFQEHPNFEISASINKNQDKYFQTSIKKIPFNSIDSVILDQYDHFIISIPPFYDLKTDIIIDKFHSYFLKRKTPYSLIYFSATSVYGDHQGQKVFEDSDLKAKSINGLARIACEQKYLELQDNKAANIIILRLAGIYGEKRNNIKAIKNREINYNKASNRLISRIHVADICNIVKQIIATPTLKNQIFNLADNSPCLTKDVNDYICEILLKIEKLPLNSKAPNLRHSSFAMDNKIVANRKLKEILNYQLIFPSYQDGLKNIYRLKIDS